MGIILVAMASGCTSQRFIQDNPYHLTAEQTDDILSRVSVLEVTGNQIEGFCPVLAAKAIAAGAALFDCQLYNPNRIYILKSDNPTQMFMERRHAANHLYEIMVLGVSIEDSANHKDW